jgi:TolA-binding protein
MPATQSLAASTFFAGASVGLLGVLGCVAYFAPALLRRLLLWLRASAKRLGGGGAGADGEGGGVDSSTRLLARTSTQNEASATELQQQLARSAAEISRLQVLAFSSVNGTSAVPEALAAAARAAGSSRGAGATAAAFWDRREFLQATATHCSLLLQLLDEHLVDALAPGVAQPASSAAGQHHPAEVVALASALHSLLTMTAAQAAALLASRRAAVAASSIGLASDAPPAGAGPAEAALVAQWAASAPFEAFLRSALELAWVSGALDFAGATDAVVRAWTSARGAERGGGAAGKALERALADGAAGAALRRAVALHLRLAVWPAVAQSGLRWGVRGDGLGAPEPTALDSSAHVLFSASGRALGEGASVLFVGPELSGDAELRGRGNRAIVFAG